MNMFKCTERFEIIERYVAKPELLLLAKTILLSQELREASWDNVSYTKTKYKACKEAIESTSLDIFWLNTMIFWFSCLWNESREWANRIIETLEK